MWHPNGVECQVCDMFEYLWHIGLNIDPDPHDIVFYPDSIGWLDADTAGS